ncbi:MAG: AAA family ATPase [Tepidisphaeraceae bacterium]
MHPAFSHILGQSTAIGFLTKALAVDRLPHGLIFAGPVGVGRCTTALALAKVFLADRPNDPESIDKVSPLIEARTHPDFHFVTKEMVRELEGKSDKAKAVEFSIDVVRERVVAPAGRKAVLGRGKVFILDEADTMTTGAQNALLKTLEEPAGRTLIVLLTETPGGLLSTVRSRSQLVRFGGPPEADAIAILTKHGLSPQQAASALKLAEGSPGLALRWHEDGVIMAGQELIRLLDTGGDLATWMKAAADAYAKKQLERDELSSEDAMRRQGINTFLRIACDHFRRRLAETDDDNERDRLIDRIESARLAEANVDGNVNVALILQHVGMTIG